MDNLLWEGKNGKRENTHEATAVWKREGGPFDWEVVMEVMRNARLGLYFENRDGTHVEYWTCDRGKK